MSSLHPQVKRALAPHHLAMMDRLLANCLVAPPLRNPDEWWRSRRGHASDTTTAPCANAEHALTTLTSSAATDGNGEGEGGEGRDRRGCTDAPPTKRVKLLI